jgi:glycosyltransferase involved in cell wall biosynthesis
VRSVVEAGRNGFVFRAREPEDLLDKLRSILINEELRGRMRAEARETAVTLYDREKIWDRVDKVFREAASA